MSAQRWLVEFWTKDGAWHVALPCADPSPEGLRTGGYLWTQQQFATPAEADAWAESQVAPVTSHPPQGASREVGHTPTPWKRGEIKPATWPEIPILASGQYVASVRIQATNPANHDADFIVRACNSHAALVAALEACVSFIEDSGKQGGRKWTLDTARSALAAAQVKP